MESEMKFKTGSQWKTRGGWRAMVVDVHIGCPVVWHSREGNVFQHTPYGALAGKDDYNLISEWVEPIKRTFWVNVYCDVLCVHESQQEAKKYAGIDTLDTIQIDYVQGKTHYVAKGE